MDVGRSPCRRPLGRGGLTTGRVAFGGAPLGNLGTSISDEDASLTVAAAWDRGVRHFDVAPHYGLGLAEQRLGRALSRYPRDEYIISTKVGRILEPDPSGSHHDREGFDVRTALTRHMDYPALEELRSAGVVSSYGAGSNNVAPLVTVLNQTAADVILSARSYTLADRSAAEVLLPLAQQRQASVVVAGLLSPGVLDKRTWASAHSLKDQRLLVLETVCRRRGVPLIAAALQFPLRHPAVTAICVGVRSADEVAQDLELCNLEIGDDFWDELRSVTN